MNFFSLPVIYFLLISQACDARNLAKIRLHSRMPLPDTTLKTSWSRICWPSKRSARIMDCSTFPSIFLLRFLLSSPRVCGQFSYLRVSSNPLHHRQADAKYCKKHVSLHVGEFSSDASFEVDPWLQIPHSLNSWAPVMDYQNFFALIHLALPSLRKDSAVKSLFQFYLFKEEIKWYQPFISFIQKWRNYIKRERRDKLFYKIFIMKEFIFINFFFA